ncbi:hypothetical protein KSE_69440 [Kitasatospora setae KM-6054]|uniref:PLL-like beta propeller domain-containing protein n=1 Tax=Kitasatospora setae (strain ATCC 33774 / DSM 43861 / JCM 3304 / KCC A-0304 / NBRC 14216 / KM-6054) TaxID=452652 RepID=E4N3G8_KITSK|nr:hypothetical protein KSE_69440 [Kitasatospora setae KM-6054]
MESERVSWTQIPGGMTTALPVAAAIAAGDKLFVLAVGEDQGVYYNVNTGGAWATAWTKIPGGQTKNAVCTLVNPAGVPSVIITGLDGKLYCASWQDDKNGWTAWQSLDGGAGSTPVAAAAVDNGKRYAFFLTGNDKHVHVDGDTYKVAF